MAERMILTLRLQRIHRRTMLKKKKILRISLKMYLKHLVILQKRNKYTIAVIILEITKLKI